MWRRLGPTFSFQGTELLTHKVTISCSTAVSEDLHSHKREELKNKKGQDSFENCLSSHGQANSLKSLVKGGEKKDVAIYFSMIDLQSCVYVPLNPKASSLGRTGIW